MKKLLKEDYVHGGTQKDFYEEDEREYTICPLCSADDFTKIESDRGLEVVKCKQCDLIYTNPRARDAQENYFGDKKVFYEEARLIFNGKRTHHRDRNYENQVAGIQKYKKSGNLLDVGAGMGFFLKKARDAGFDVQGVEPSPALSQIAEERWELKMHNGFLEDIELPKNYFDVISLIDVFEHVTHPKELLSLSYELLKPDGIMAIKVPNADYNLFKKQLSRGSNRDVWDCREHVVHYTPRTLRKMIESKGYKVLSASIPLPVHLPIWENLVGHYYQYPSPYILDWKRIALRNLFYHLGRMEFTLRGKTRFGPDLMFIIAKK